MASDVEFVVDSQRIRPKDSEVFRLYSDNTKIKNITGFSPKYDIKTGLKETCDWFTNPNNLKKYKTDIYNV